MATFRAAKAAFDPHDLLNPGKNIPTPARCSEFRTIKSAAADTAPGAQQGGQE
ncbi:FAD-linked oxidase C-terminal domain-containing protein [Billgrantia desiderata]|uniref:FAD-linked oxidase C-terminal domain-containing protein n=1 Tax=Billgrantia desiderata TaxID=52021 RepID=UPI003F3AA0E3